MWCKNRFGPAKRLRLTAGFGLCAVVCVVAWSLPSAGVAQVSSNLPSLELPAAAVGQVTTNLPSFELPAPESTPPMVTNPPIELPPITPPPAPLPPRLSGSSQLAGPPPVGGVSPLPLLQWGPVTFRPHLFYTLSYGNGLQGSPGQQGNTLINEIAPGISLQLGEHWTLDYTPALRYYSSTLFQDTLDHRVVLTGGTSYRDWTFGLSQSYASTSEPLVETASQLDQETYSTALSGTYRMSTALSLELAADQNFQFLTQNVPGEQLTDMRGWSTMDWLNYQFWPNVGAAIGAGFEYDDVSLGPDSTAERVQGRITWRVGNKLSLIFSGGFEDRQYLSSEASDLVNPIFSLSAAYRLFTTTSLFVSAGRTVSPAYFSGQVSENTSLSGGVSQRLFRRLSLNVTGGYGKTAYQNTTTGPSISGAGDYDNTSLSVSLSTAFFKRATAAAFYQLAYYYSSSAIFNYSTTQVGLSVGYRF